MLKLPRSEIALGALLATIFWIGVLGWQASYTPTESEKQECQDAAKKAGRKTEECKSLWEKTTTDPVAFFTFVLAVSTISLWVATLLGGRRQSRDMQASIAVSTAAVNVAQKSYEAEHRTWLKVYPIEIGPVVFEKGKFRVTVVIEAQNAGANPAVDVALGCDIFEIRRFAIGQDELNSVIQKTKRWAEIGVKGIDLIPEEKTSVSFTSDALRSPALESKIQEQIAAGVPQDVFDYLLFCAAYCAIYKAVASTDWRHSAAILMIQKTDKTPFEQIEGSIRSDALKVTIISTESRFS
jgi:hypothetical protein